MTFAAAPLPVPVSPTMSKVESVGAMRLSSAKICRIGTLFPVTYLVLDGHFGNNNALQMTRRCQLHLISKLRADSALYLPYGGPYAGRGPRRISGDKRDGQALPAHTLRQTPDTDGIITRTYQVEARHKSFAQPLNLVVIVKTNQQTQRQAHVLLFSSDLALPFAHLIDDYG